MDLAGVGVRGRLANTGKLEEEEKSAPLSTCVPKILKAFAGLLMRESYLLKIILVKSWPFDNKYC